MRHSHDHRPALITDAPESLDDEFDHRRKRYAIMMALRALCVIAAAATYRVSWVLAVVLVVGGAVLPWCAVILANDRPPRRTRRLRPFQAPHDERALQSGQDQRALPAGRDERTSDDSARWHNRTDEQHADPGDAEDV